MREEESYRSPWRLVELELIAVVDGNVVVLAAVLPPSSLASPLPPERVLAQLARLPDGLDPYSGKLRLGNFGN